MSVPYTVSLQDANPHTLAGLAPDWARLRAADPTRYSPYFHPEYCARVHEICGDVRVAVARHEGRVIGLMPFQGGRAARPLGAPMTDYHGPLGILPTADILRAAGISTFAFSGLVEPGAMRDTGSQIAACIAHLDGEPDVWRAARDSAYRRHLKSNRRRIRRATEDVGEPRLVTRSRDVDVFNTLVRWKREKFAATGKYDVLSRWPRDLVRALWEDTGALRADMHVLMFGDRVAAIDLGLVDTSYAVPTFHSWIVAYDADLSAYAPGIQLLERLIDAAPDLGYDRLDLGAETDGYKRHYATLPIRVGAGTLAIQGPLGGTARLYAALETQSETLARLRRRWTQVAACEPGLIGRAKGLSVGLRAAPA